MKLIIAGGSGQVGQVLARHHLAAGDEVVILGRRASAPTSPSTRVSRVVGWDARSDGPWMREVDGADVVVNLAGRTVNCRYTPENVKAMLDSRVESTEAIGRAITAAASPPRVWLQMSTATIYSHRYDAANDELTGVIGGEEPDVPAYWSNSVKIAKAWEDSQSRADTPRTRKVALRTTMVMSPDVDGIFDVMLGLVRKGLGGSAGDGRQYVSWMHDRDFVRATSFLVEHEELEGPVNMGAPEPLPYREFMAAMRAAWGTRIGLPAAKWMLSIGAFAMGTDTELVLKSRRVTPERLLRAGFEFSFPNWRIAADDLVARWRAARAARART